MTRAAQNDLVERLQKEGYTFFEQSTKKQGIKLISAYIAVKDNEEVARATSKIGLLNAVSSKSVK